jgi:hypothetical protein
MKFTLSPSSETKIEVYDESIMLMRETENSPG